MSTFCGASLLTNLWIFPKGKTSRLCDSLDWTESFSGTGINPVQIITLLSARSRWHNWGCHKGRRQQCVWGQKQPPRALNEQPAGQLQWMNVRRLHLVHVHLTGNIWYRDEYQRAGRSVATRGEGEQRSGGRRRWTRGDGLTGGLSFEDIKVDRRLCKRCKCLESIRGS